MKTKVVAVLLAAMMMVSLAACGNSSSNDSTEDTTEAADSTEAASYSIEDSTKRLIDLDNLDTYVTVGKYKGIELEKTITEVTDEDVDAQIDSALTAAATESTDTEQEVVDGDTVNIDYVGRVGEIAFQGGTAEAQSLVIGSNSYIDGFEEGIIGMKAGETKELNLTFPEDYQDTSLAGKDTVFTVTLNSISVTPELTDEWVAANTDYETVDEYKAGIKADLEATNEETADSSLLSTAWSQVVDASEIKEYPEDELAAVKEDYIARVKDYAEQQGTTFEEMLEAQGQTEEDFDTYADEYAKSALEETLILQSILDAEGLELTDEEFDSAKTEMTETYAMSIADLVEQYGSEVYTYLARQVVQQMIVDSADITETTPEATTAETTEAAE
ncbi:MAG: trigger factor [Lachnospiraceae bacterium]